MKIICPRCFAEYEVQPDVIGQKVECQQCKNQWIAESDPTSTFKQPSTKSDSISISEPTPEMKLCPICGESILAVAKKCRYCGEYLTTDFIPIRRRNRGFYCLLGIFFGQLGVHNFYAEQNSEGFKKLSFLGLAGCLALIRLEWLSLFFLVLILGLTVVDLCYDPNIQINKKKRNRSELIVGLLTIILFITIPILIDSKIITIDSIEQYLKQ